MAGIVNLRTARKRAQRRQDDERARANGLAHGQPKAVRALEVARRSKASRDLDRHKIEPGDDQ